MTEAEWLASDDPNAMYDCLREQHGVTRRKAGKRKTRLFGCASCRLFGAALADPRSAAAVEYMERFADGAADPAQMDAIGEQARLALLDAVLSAHSPGRALHDPPWRAAEAAFNIVEVRGRAYAHWAMRTTVGGGDTTQWGEWVAARRALADLLRDILGNPFRAVAFDPAWRTSDVMLLAQGIYEERAFDRMPILADALQEAGCVNEDILAHCLDANTLTAGELPAGSPVTPSCHARGCWVVDLVLGKA